MSGHLAPETMLFTSFEVVTPCLVSVDVPLRYY